MLGCVEIVSASDHQLLSYAFRVQQQGYRLTVAEFEAYAESPSRRPGQSTLKGFAAMARGIAMLAESQFEITPAETPVTHFQRVKWISVDDERVNVTQLGRAVVMAADAGSQEVEVVQAALDPNDPLAYARLVAHLAQLDNVMVVDPYFRCAQFLDLYRLPTLTRVLTSPKIGKKALAEITATAGVVQWGRSFEVRAAKSDAGMHDRILIPSAGSVYQVGTSLGSIGDSFTVLSEIQDLADTVRDHFEKVWSDAEVIFSAKEESSEDEA
jgi:hypothetical protein